MATTVHVITSSRFIFIVSLLLALLKCASIIPHFRQAQATNQEQEKKQIGHTAFAVLWFFKKFSGNSCFGFNHGTHRRPHSRDTEGSAKETFGQLANIRPPSMWHTFVHTLKSTFAAESCSLLVVECMVADISLTSIQ
jgi:hypothetical protein